MPPHQFLNTRNNRMELTNRRILLGITGGIAAFKCADLVRRLRERGAEVRVVVTPSAAAFITPLTLQAVSGHPVAESLLDPAAEAAMGHIELARWADLVLIAPASANFLARLTAGLGNDLLSTLCLATAAPIAVAPAMNQQMWQAAATTENLATLARRGTLIWGPAAGSQACGEVGPGRMLEPLELVDHCVSHFATDGPLSGKKVLITAGPTREPLDPVRFLTNHSSGKMGFALAGAARKLGAEVELVSGPVSLATPTGCLRTDVETALEMHQAVMSRVDECDLFIACAAVADYRPKQIADHKIKKGSESMSVELVKNPDIVAEVAAKTNKPFTIGFAAETRDVVTYAHEKMLRKGLDMIAANDVSADQQGFNTDTNALLVLWPGGQQRIPLADKKTVAEALLALAAERYRSMNEID